MTIYKKIWKAEPAEKKGVSHLLHIRKNQPQRHKDTKEPQRDFVRLCVFVAKKRMCPAFYPKKSATKPQRHKDTKEPQKDFVRLRAFVAKTDVSRLLHIRKNQPQRHKGTTERLRETLCLRGKKRMRPAFYPKKSATETQRNHGETS
ncbi:hypothetical protein [Desulfonema magnum]|uniref:hypothetical protein n=1 Tax=Desulfonema magnum TaxID=45655 RepID=UPI001A9B3882|nr:hypothetical protein [Desulfonema magnum]